MLTKEDLEDFLKAIEKVEIGEGDLTTEVVVPYPRFGAGRVISKNKGFFAGEKIIETLVRSSGERINLTWHIKDGKQIKENDTVFSFEGKISDILARRRIIEYVLGRASAIATHTRRIVGKLERVGKKLVSPSKVVPGYEVIDNYAFTIGGGIVRSEGLKDSIYITPEHVEYGGGIEQVVDCVLKEVGIARKKIKIEVEVVSFLDFQRVNELDIDVIHISSNATREDILKIFAEGNPKKKPVLHLRSINDWDHEFAPFFFVYLCVENIFTEVVPLEFKVKIEEGAL